MKKQKKKELEKNLISNGEAKVENSCTWYLPHFGVVNPNKRGKFRLVFDTAAKSDDVSLDDVLMKGPDRYNSLLGVFIVQVS